MEFIKLSEVEFDKLPEKRVTIRKGRKNYPIGHACFISAELGRIAEIKIIRIEYVKLGNIYEIDIKDDGFKDWNDAFNGLKQYYPDLSWDDELTVVKFVTVKIHEIRLLQYSNLYDPRGRFEQESLCIKQRIKQKELR